MSIHRGEVIPTGLIAITPNDSTALDLVGFVVTGTTGNVALVDGYGQSSTFVVGTAGVSYALKVTKIMSTGTTATGIFGYRA